MKNPSPPGFWPTVPGWAIITSYQRGWTKGDFLAGCTVAAYLVPQCMAYATIAGLPPVVGLWTIIPCLAIYAVFGSSRQMSIGPESTTALMTAAVVAPLAAGDPVRYAALSAALAFMVGVLCLLAWIIRLGFIADLLSRPVLVGYMAGIAALMIVGQLSHLTGVPVAGEGFRAEVSSFVKNLNQTDPATLIMGIIVLLFLFIAAWRWPSLPGPLLAVLLATAAVMIFNLERFGIDVVGPFSNSMPTHGLPTLGDFTGLVVPALGVLLVGYTDVMLTARAFATKESGNVDANQELFALGTSNLGAGAIGGFPISSSASRTALAITAGARTQLYSIVALLWTLAVIFFLGPLLARFPTVALGAIVLYAATHLIDIPGFARLWSFRRIEFALAICAFAGVLIFGILTGVLLAVALSVAEMLRRISRAHDAVQGFVPGLAGMHDVNDYPETITIPGLVVYRYDSPLFFANADDFRVNALEAVNQNEDDVPVAWLLLNMEANVEVDITAMYALEALRVELERRGIVLALTRVKHELYLPLQRFGLVNKIGNDHIYPTLPTAIAGFRHWETANASST
ncbi:MAG: SulP family inorganic anion transporter [Actinomycetes bacterium]